MLQSELSFYCQKCFRAGLILGKCLVSKWDSEESVVQVFLTLNQQVEGSIPSALTIFRINNLNNNPTNSADFPARILFHPIIVFSTTYIESWATDAYSVVHFGCRKICL